MEIEPMKTKLLTIIVPIVALSLTLASACAGEMAYLDVFLMFADKSTLMIKLGRYKEQMAMKITFGHGLGAEQIGLVFTEKLDDATKQKIRDEGFKKLTKQYRKSHPVPVAWSADHC
jgi:hypothetical protein